MPIIYKAVILHIFVFLFSLSVNAQDTTGQKQDSARNQILIDQSKQLQDLQNAMLADSLKRADLENQLSDLKSTDNLKKQELLQQLEQIRNRDSLRLLQKKSKIDSLRNVVRGFIVAPFFDDSLFVIYNKLGSFGPADRAEAISRRIKKLAGDFGFKADSIKVIPGEQTSDITYGETIIMSVSENDALWMHTSKELLADEYKTKISDAIVAYRKQTSWKTILKQVGLALLVIGVLVAIIYYLGRLGRWSRMKIISQRGKLIKGIRIKHYQLFDARRQVGFFLLLNTILKWILIITAIYLAFPVLFGIFPWTKKFANTLLSYFLDPLKSILNAVWEYLPNLFTIIVIIIVFRYVIKGLRFLRKEVEIGELKIPGFYPDWANPTFQIIRVLIFAFMIIVIFPYLPGSESPVFRGVSVFLGLLFTFGSAGSLSNIVAGLVLTYMRAFKIGDRVKIGDVTGDIIEKSLLVTRIRTIKNEIVSIPNSTVMSSHTTNFSSEVVEKGLIMHSTVTIGYDVPWRQVHQLLIDAATATDMVEKEPAPFVLQTSLDDFYVSYQINAYTKEPNKQAVIYSQLHQHIQDKFNEAGVEIMSPHYRGLRDGNQTTIPADYLPKDYITPSFRVQKPDEKKEEK